VTRKFEYLELESESENEFEREIVEIEEDNVFQPKISTFSKFRSSRFGSKRNQRYRAPLR